MTKSYVNEYFSSNFSLNRFYVNSSDSFNTYISLTFSFKNPQNFKESDKETVNIQTPIQNSNPPATTVVSGTGYNYLQIPTRVNVFALEIPVTFYFKKSKIGIDFAIKGGVNDPNKNNVSGRLGLFFPVSRTGKDIITLEPLLKFQKLFNTSDALFIKDNVVFGFSLSFAVPKLFK